MRNAQIERVTNETKIKLTLNLDGEGKYNISTSIGFFDHMLSHICRHGFFDMDIEVMGDIEVDCHHTIEDTGIALGKAFARALGGKEGIKRYGQSLVPMDETLVMCAVDFSGRPFLGFDAVFTTDRLGDMDTEMTEEFFRGFCVHAGLTMHIKVLDGKNNHHIAEGIFKAAGRALDDATAVDPRVRGVLSTKGMLES